MIYKVSLSDLYDKVCQAAGAAFHPNISYCASIDLGDAFPAVIQLGAIVDGDGCDYYSFESLLDTLQFLAMNGRLFPRSLRGATLDDFKKHLLENADKIFGEIEQDIKHYLCEYRTEDSDGLSCPFCESTDVCVDENDGRHCCRECGRLFDDDDIRREELRHRLSPRLADTSEEEPMAAMVPVGEDGCVVENIFQFEDGTMWYRLVGDSEYQDIDTLSISDLEKVVNAT